MSTLASPSEEVEITPAGVFPLRKESQAAPCGLRQGEYSLPPLPSYVERGQGCQTFPAIWAALFKETLILILMSLARLKVGDELRDLGLASSGLPQKF